MKTSEAISAIVARTRTSASFCPTLSGQVTRLKSVASIIELGGSYGFMLSLPGTRLFASNVVSRSNGCSVDVLVDDAVSDVHFIIDSRVMVATDEVQTVTVASQHQLSEENVETGRRYL